MELKLEATADALRAYRDEFAADLFADLEDKENILTTVERLTYILAKACDPRIESLDEWKASIKDPFAVIQAADQVITFFNRSMTPTCRPVEGGAGAYDRESTTGLFLLRALQMGLTMADLKFVTVGMVLDMTIERGNDSHEYPKLGTQADMDAFKGF